MLTSVSQEFRKFSRHCYTLRMILKDTSRSLEDIQCNLSLGEEFRENFRKENVIGRLQHMLEECLPAVLVFGQSCHVKATFINYMLDQTILPLNSSGWRWVRLSYGHTKEIRLTLMHEYEILDNLQAHQRPWVTVPESDLKRTEQESTADSCQALEIKLNSAFLKDKVNILVPPDYPSECLSDTLKDLIHILPVIIYVVDESLNDCHIQEIRIIKEAYQDLPILFINMTKNGIETLSPPEQPILRALPHLKNDKFSKKYILLKNQLINLGFIRDNVMNGGEFTQPFCTEYNNMLSNDYEFNDKFVIFVRHTFKSYLLNMSSKLSMIHNECLKNFILRTFDMAREIQITPQRIKYAQITEAGLYRALMEIAGKKQEELVRIIQSTLHDMKLNAKQILEDYYCEEMDGNNSHQSFTKPVSTEIQQIILNKLGNAVAIQLVQSVGCLHENFTGTLQRCLENLEKNCKDQDGNVLASDAVKKIITAAYSIELKSSSSFSIAHSFMERLRNFIHSFQLPWVAHSQQQYDFSWRLQTVTNMLDSLSSSKLAKTVSAQEVVRSSHEAFQAAMRSLEHQLSGKLERMEEQRIAIRKQYAPRFARLALESTSLCDLVQWGMPIQSKEIGRGQYGVVFACEPWGGIDPCAVKSVVPPDDRHWNDLAMEFYHTRTIAEHPRIVKLRGSVIDHQYGGGFSAAVLLVMERMNRDLYCGLRNGLSWLIRLQIAIDVIEGIRYLHSQGLVHRDIKLKNVLLDNNNRAKLTDFGFCIPEAMMSGSIVGTPVHMAPELLSGHYDSSVDVYAFGILFWYICANQVRLPYVFEQFLNKEQLWTSVRRGLRPECLPIFSKGCWNLMERCWAADPEDRPPLGEVQPILEAIWYKATMDTSIGKVHTKNNCPSISRNDNDFVENYEYSQNPYVYLREY
ncbi:dual serine/threonine and tyrosine protein kinase-like isoform X2 [Photinus pyralis]|uniref:dual serine/threonine and tyrosine protein kinase-like isoform X2 n=1 Tax=Photinus pyralis TaxID=7054 RepID=UPI0012672F59|nr:dual serine/threonine and tyrosine protein kinase-like isoform X2 [Photinus pyralis]